ncbi:MAG: adenylate kinase [Bifidobacteriaceae bacterium]|jgi:adenylate kinase|nr:adenylate kinase [Bifidobacteriaceae bacterium]
MNAVVLLGPPGSGKGTQADGLAAALGVPTISTGAIFRANLSEGTALGVKAGEFMSKGELVPDEITDAMVADRLAQADCQDGFVLDGYPRNPAQVTALDQVLSEQGRAIVAALEITIPDDLIVERLLGRAAKEGRADDTEPVIRNRIAVYHEQTAPVSNLYAQRGLLRSIDGVGTVAEVATRLLAAAGIS